jgi:hypothetical protein
MGENDNRNNPQKNVAGICRSDHVDPGSTNAEDLECGRSLDLNQAKKQIAFILRERLTVHLIGHAIRSMDDDDMTMVDVTNVLRCGKITEAAEQVKGFWRYRVKTDIMAVVVQFLPDGNGLKVITVWRL